MAVKVITEANFEQEVVGSEKPVLVDFWASWCGPCRMLSPIVDAISEEDDSIVVGKVNVDEEMELAQRFKVSSIPCVMLFKNGEVAARTVGVQPKEQLKAALGL
ncbi:MAG: thioredoxin [Clostridia bacterium]|nr:thioredoxin [Clostridia bacterium]